MITSILFDMDGVLINSQPMHFQADIQSMKHFGITITAEEMEKYAGTTNRERFTLFKELYHLDASIDEMVTYREQSILDIIRSMDVKPIAGIPELLQDVKRLNLKTAVASASSYALIDLVLEKLNIQSFFDLVVSGEEVAKGKPEPDVFLLTAQRLHKQPFECVVVEDSANGVKAAIRANMKVLGYQNPDSGSQNLSKANRVIDDFRKIRAQDLLQLQ